LLTFVQEFKTLNIITMLQRTRKVGGLVSATEILKAGGVDKWVEKVGYDSKKIKMSGIISLTEKQVEEALKSLKK
jgi:hypothetical protein